MTNGWTPERRAKQQILIRTWRPWEKSTGPKTSIGKALSAARSYKGGYWKVLRTLNKALKVCRPSPKQTRT